MLEEKNKEIIENSDLNIIKEIKKEKNNETKTSVYKQNNVNLH